MSDERKYIYINCAFWAIWQWAWKGGYLVVRRAYAGWFWHFAWMQKQGDPIQHFQSAKPIHFPWPVQKGYIAIGEVKRDAR